MELRRRSPHIGRRLWRTHSRDRRTLAICTPAQPPRHLLSMNRQLIYPVFVLLKTCPQQDALLSVPVEVLPVTIQPLLKSPLYVILSSQDFSQLTPQISHQPPELSYLVLQSSDIAVHLLLLKRGSLTYPDTPRRPGTHMGSIHRNLTSQLLPHDCRIPYGPGRCLLWCINQLLIPETSIEEVEQNRAIW